MMTENIFRETLPAALDHFPELASRTRAIIQIELTGEAPETWTVDLQSSPPRVLEGASERSHVTTAKSGRN